MIMSDHILISYCEIHCKTERALFGADMINRMIDLSGAPYLKIPLGTWVVCREEMENMCQLARERMKNETI